MTVDSKIRNEKLQHNIKGSYKNISIIVGQKKIQFNFQIL